jgi:hypothetical protein
MCIVHQGCQIFLRTTYQKEKKYTKYVQNRPNGHKIYQRPPLKDHKKFTQISIFENIPSGNPVCSTNACKSIFELFERQLGDFGHGVHLAAGVAGQPAADGPRLDQSRRQECLHGSLMVSLIQIRIIVGRPFWEKMIRSQCYDF